MVKSSLSKRPTGLHRATSKALDPPLHMKVAAKASHELVDPQLLRVQMRGIPK
jgi:hypothetical protein